MQLNSSHFSIIKRLILGQHTQLLSPILRKMDVTELASLLVNLNLSEVQFFVQVLTLTGKAHSVFLELPPAKVIVLFSYLKKEQLSELFKHFSKEDSAYFISLLQEDGGEKEKKIKDFLFSKMDEEKKNRVRQFLSYPKNSAGRMMNTQFFSLPVDLNAERGLEFLRSQAQKQSIYYIYCVDKHQHLVGTLSLRELIVSLPETPLTHLIQKEVVSVLPEASSEEVARLVSQYDFIALPVVDNENHLLGLITVDDVVDIIQEEATAKIYAQAGLQEDDRVFSSPLKSIKNRAPWMALNLFLALLTSSVVSWFEETMSQMIVLASLKNIIASTGGNTAIQSLTVVTRGMATGDFNFSLPFKVVLKEVVSGTVLGLLTGLGAAVLVYFWKGNLFVSGVVFFSMILTSMIASCFGTIVPILLKKIHIDPAMGSGVIVTIVIDIFSFFSFLGLASLGLHTFVPFIRD